MTTAPIMPKGTAVWLIDNTSLTFEQIAQFCGLHVLEVQALADDQSSVGMIGVDPIKLGQLTVEEIDRCSKNPNARLLLTSSAIRSIALACSKCPRISQKSFTGIPDTFALLQAAISLSPCSPIINA